MLPVCPKFSSLELCLPQSFDEFEQLSVEADFYGDLIKPLQIYTSRGSS